MNEFTPGPWVQVEKDKLFIYKLNDLGVNQFNLKVQSSNFSGADKQELLANANLIAVAPDMYEALQQALGSINTFRDMSSTIRAIEIVLAKARGKS